MQEGDELERQVDNNTGNQVVPERSGEALGCVCVCAWACVRVRVCDRENPMKSICTSAVPPFLKPNPTEFSLLCRRGLYAPHSQPVCLHPHPLGYYKLL